MFRKIDFHKKTPPKKRKGKSLPRHEDLRDHYGGRDGVNSLYDIKLRSVQDIPRVRNAENNATKDLSVISYDCHRIDAPDWKKEKHSAKGPISVQVDGPVQWHRDMSPIKMVPVSDKLAKETKPKDKQKESGRLLPQRVPSRRVAPLPVVKDKKTEGKSPAIEPMPDYSETGYDFKSSEKEFSAIIQEKNVDDIELSMICIESDEAGNETEGERWGVGRHLSNVSNVSKYQVRRRESRARKDKGISPRKDEQRSIGSPLELLQSYFEAIVRDDTENVNTILASIPKAGLDCFLNGNFEFEYSEMLPNQTQSNANQGFFIRQMNMTRPLSLAAFFKSKKVFNMLIDNGTNPFMPDANHNNIVHILILASFYQPKSEQDYIQIYQSLISRIQHGAQRKYLLHSENLDMLRPIEMALKLKRFTFFRHLLHTCGVERIILGGSGTICCCVHDMSPYITIGERQNRSPLYLLFDTTEDEFVGLAESGVLQDPVVRSWIDAIWHRNLPYLVAWVILFRLLYLFVFISFDIKCYSLFAQYLSLNSTSSDTEELKEHLKVDKNTMQIGFLVLFFISLLSILFDIVSLVYFLFSRWKLRRRNLPQWLQQEGCGYIHKMFLFYRLHYFLLAITTVVHSSIEFNDLNANNPDLQTFCTILLIFKYLLALMAISYFLMVIPILDIFIIGLQRLIYTIYIFVLLYLPLYFIFLAVMHYVLAYHCRIEARLHHDFSTNMYLIHASSDQLAHCNAAGRALSVLVQYLHLFIFCILFTNHLITYIFTDFLRLARCKSVVVSLVRLHMAIVIENRIGRHRYSVSKTETVKTYEFCNGQSIKHTCVTGMSL